MDRYVRNINREEWDEQRRRDVEMIRESREENLARKHLIQEMRKQQEKEKVRQRVRAHRERKARKVSILYHYVVESSSLMIVFREKKLKRTTDLMHLILLPHC